MKLKKPKQKKTTDDDTIDLADKESVEKNMSPSYIRRQKLMKYASKVNDGESSDAFVERVLEERSVDAIKRIELDLLYGDDRTSRDAASDILERRGFARNDQRVKNQLPQAPMVVVFQGTDAGQLGFLGGSTAKVLDAVVRSTPEEAPSKKK